jgi:L-lactate dehydrogenase complex protein LldG
MSDRKKILGRIREALAVPAPRPGHAPETSSHPADLSRQSMRAKAEARRWLPAVGESFDEQLDLFRANAADLRADFQLLTSRDELAPRLRQLAQAEGWKRVASHRGELSQLGCDALNLPIFFTDQSYDPLALEACDVGITECDALIAQTGSVLVTSRSAGGRAASVLPPHHVVIARRDQLLADLPAAFDLVKRKYSPGYPSFISLITGPSRTGDIERILVLGAHGPKKLTVFCF